MSVNWLALFWIFERNGNCIAIWPVDIGDCAFQAGSNCKSQPICSAHTRTHICEGWRRRSEQVNEKWEVGYGDKVINVVKMDSNQQKTQTMWTKTGKKNNPSTFSFFPLNAVPSGDQRWGKLLRPPLCCWCCGCPTGRRTHRQSRTAAPRARWRWEGVAAREASSGANIWARCGHVSVTSARAFRKRCNRLGLKKNAHGRPEVVNPILGCIRDCRSIYNPHCTHPVLYVLII